MKNKKRTQKNKKKYLNVVKEKLKMEIDVKILLKELKIFVININNKIDILFYIF